MRLILTSLFSLALAGPLMAANAPADAAGSVGPEAVCERQQQQCAKQCDKEKTLWFFKGEAYDSCLDKCDARLESCMSKPGEGRMDSSRGAAAADRAAERRAAADERRDDAEDAAEDAREAAEEAAEDAREAAEEAAEDAREAAEEAREAAAEDAAEDAEAGMERGKKRKDKDNRDEEEN